MYQFAASIMCADQMNLKKELTELEKAETGLLHCDVMDGVFVDNMAMGPYILEEIKENTSIPLDIHLATVTPFKYMKMFAHIKPKYISFHIETSENPEKEIEFLREKGISPSLALSPETPVSEIVKFLPLVDMLLIMTVNPGFAGQPFNYSVIEKLKELNIYLKEMENPPLIEVDGNINEKTIPILYENNANVYVLGTSALFNTASGTYKEKIEKLTKLFI
ncbi:ribulose-phosphate 3-epimerase [Sebaldella sp. S0638]|uniref:ribulose-phosphate 3-epimerase n=1 Tax=Sebaldella sp. S0638 TaxID=2957809 RepID=UPI0020A136E5|nr:ribulose-phosphate 3-epimerase [Sebaldella sp. S0638]MCP1225864.1 ribulose-phosphate 3-epimerase [Sebaldella sp. S0638]